jgi:glycosyltransferase involved in cell wall biosynthesis
MKQNKNICMITQSPYPIDPRVRRQAEKLEKEGYNVDILCVETFNAPKVEAYGSVTAYRILKYIRHEDQLNYFLFSIKFFLISFIKLQFLYKEKHYSLIQVHNMPDYHIFIGFIQKIFFRVPLVLDIHDLTVDLFQEKWSSKKSGFILPFVKFIEKISCGFSDQVLTVTQECVNILIKRGIKKEKIELILNSANEEIFEFDENREFKEIKSGLKLFYHGTVAERFGIHIVIKALPAIIETIPQTKLILYGKYDPSYKKYLSELISELKLENSVEFNSSVPIEKIIELIKTVDIGVVPYMASEYMHLSLSTKAFEYAASGLPIISSRLRSMETIFSESSISFFEPGNPVILADKVIELCGNPSQRKKQIFSALGDLQTVSWKIVSDKYLNIISQLIKKKNL